MKATLLHVLFAALCAGFWCSQPAGAAQCTAAGLTGNWGYTYNGTVYVPDATAVAAVGHFTLHLNGNVSGTQTHALGGQPEVENISGVATVNPDCTGTATINVSLNGQLIRTAVLNIVYDENEKHARMIFVSITLPGDVNVPPVITLDANRIGAKD